MICLDTHITEMIDDFFFENQNLLLNYLEINSVIKEVSGIHHFFDSQKETSELLLKMRSNSAILCKESRREYGDFQTNPTLACQVLEYVLKQDESIEFVLEPTCGKGNFLLACIAQFKKLKKVVGVEIHQSYVWETKFRILRHFLSHPISQKPEIEIVHQSAFAFDYLALANSTKNLKTLVIGNPPWMTNSELGSMDSKNLPNKSNFKKHSGLDALTGKGNFDIGESIAHTMLQCFDQHNGFFAFLMKNSVVKNLIHDQKTNRFRIGNPQKFKIDAKKEFQVSVNASLFFSRFNAEPAQTCTEFDFYSREWITTFGWYKRKFVNSIGDYKKSRKIEGTSPFIWRSGVKHDCSKVMELYPSNGKFKNALGEEISIEHELTYGLLKSSDLKTEKTNSFRKIIIITQKIIGQETAYIKDQFPLTYQYLDSHKEFFEKRKSCIYKYKPNFSIFGIGDYSFSKYKVAISGLYKSTHFTLVTPATNKPIMLDDTCYFIGFDDLKMAEIVHYLMNSELVQKFLQAIIFSDAKRPITKNILMRIDFEKAFEKADFQKAIKRIKGLEIEDWQAFGKMVTKEVPETMMLF